MERKDIVVVGAGGFGREVIWQISKAKHYTDKYNILGFIDDTPELQTKLINGFPVIGNIQWLADYSKEICVVISIGSAKSRKKVYDKIKNNLHISFPTIIADDVQYSDFVKLGQGCIICLSNILTVNITIGEFVIANLDCTIGHDVVIEDFVTLYPSVNVSGNVHIGCCTEIGTGTNIIQGKSVGKNTILGAGSVVVKDIPSNCTAVGIPAMPIKFNEES